MRLSEGSQEAIRFTKLTLNNWLRQAGPAFDASLGFEFYGFAGPDVREGVASHREKRSPHFGERSGGPCQRRRNGEGRRAVPPGMKVDVWSDVICPVVLHRQAPPRDGHRAVRARRRGRGGVAQLRAEPAPPVLEARLADGLARKFGGRVDEAEAMNDHMTDLAERDGLAYHLGHARPGNTLDAHRLIHLAARARVAG